MPPDLSSAILGAIIAALVAMGAAVTLLPPFLRKQMEIYQTAQESKIKIEQEKSQDAIAEARQEREDATEQRKQFGRLVDSLISERAGQQQQQEVMIKALTGSVAVLDSMAKELHANTTVVTASNVGVGELTNRMDTLIEKGSVPLHELDKKVGKLGTDVATLVASQKNTSDKVNVIHERIDEIIALKNTLEIMLKVAQAKLDDIRKATGEIPATLPA